MSSYLQQLEFDRFVEGDFGLVESLRCREGECHVSFVDIERGVLGQTRPRGIYTRDVAPMVAFAQSIGEHGFLFAAGRRIGFSPSEEVSHWSEPLLPESKRFNDGAVDSAGRLVIGTLSLDSDGSSLENQLLLLDSDQCMYPIRQKIGLSNGIAVSPDNGDLFHVDTYNSTIHRIPLDSVSGEYREPEMFHRFKQEENPDGLLLLETGDLLVALWGDGTLVRIDSGGQELERVRVPPTFPTSVCICNTCGELWLGNAAQPRGKGLQTVLSGGVWRAHTLMRQVPQLEWRQMQVEGIQLSVK